MNPFSDQETLPDDLYSPEKFPEPRTYPNGRNMETSFMEWTSRVGSKPKTDQEAAPDWEPEKFPQPNTYPNGWDISTIYNDEGSRK